MVEDLVLECELNNKELYSKQEEICLFNRKYWMLLKRKI